MTGHTGQAGYLITYTNRHEGVIIIIIQLIIIIIIWVGNSLTITVEPLYCGHHWDRSKCPEYRGVLISEVVLYINDTFGFPESVLIIEVSSFQSVLIIEWCKYM